MLSAFHSALEHTTVDLSAQGAMAQTSSCIVVDADEPHWIRVKNPYAPVLKREAKEEWGNDPAPLPRRRWFLQPSEQRSGPSRCHSRRRRTIRGTATSESAASL